MNDEGKLKILLNILKDAKVYQGIIEEQETTNPDDCEKLSYPVNSFAIDIAKPIIEFNKGFDHELLRKNCDGVIVCSDGKLILAELKTNPLNKDKCIKIWKQIVASYISLCALLYVFSLDIKNFSVEIAIAGCKARKDLDSVERKRAGYKENSFLMFCIKLIREGKLIVKCFPQDILKLLQVHTDIELNSEVYKSDVLVTYLICDNCK